MGILRVFMRKFNSFYGILIVFMVNLRKNKKKLKLHRYFGWKRYKLMFLYYFSLGFLASFSEKNVNLIFMLPRIVYKVRSNSVSSPMNLSI